MELFEILILSSGGYPSLTVREHYTNGDAAIRAARLIAQDKAFEVWDSEGCTFTSPTCLTRAIAA